MQIRLFFILLFLLSFSLSGRASDWSKSLNISLTVNQSQSKTGATGQMTENATLNYGLLVNGELTKNNKKVNWKNTLKLEYARSKNTTKVGDVYTSTPKWTEDIDQLILDSVHRWKSYKYLNPYVAANLQTAVLDAVNNEVPGAFKPVQLRESGGVGMPIIDKESQNLVGRAGIFVQHYVNKAANEESTNGIELVFDYKNQIKKDMLLTSKLGLYSSLKKTMDPGAWGNTNNESKKIRLEWDNTFITTISKYISMNLTYNVDNVDITESKAHYEWEQKMNIAFNYKVF